MAKKKIVKKAVKKVAMETTPAYPTDEGCYCKGILALVIIVLVWWQPAVMWSQITITIAAALILLSAKSCPCKK